MMPVFARPVRQVVKSQLVIQANEFGRVSDSARYRSGFWWVEQPRRNLSTRSQAGKVRTLLSVMPEEGQGTGAFRHLPRGKTVFVAMNGSHGVLSGSWL